VLLLQWVSSATLGANGAQTPEAFPLVNDEWLPEVTIHLGFHHQAMMNER
jgi:hypothetical protein